MSATAQDIILKQDGSEIKTKVIEITDQQIKYKEFDFQDGPIRNINISEVFMITYESGQKEVFNKNTSPSKRESDPNCVKNTAFGLDIGLGGSFFTMYNDKAPSLFASSVGIRAMHHFNPYFGIDFLKMNWITDVLKDEWAMRLQFMSGIRGNSPTFFECMSVYSAFRLGYGMTFGLLTHYEGLCLETELGLNLTPTVFAGFAYNYHGYFVKGEDSKLAMHTLSFRLGFNFGKIQETKKRDIFNKQTSKPQSVRNCTKNTAFGLDIGLGGSFETYNNEKLPASWFAPALGIRVMHHFNPYFGVDFLKINWITDVLTSESEDFWQMRLQFMSGIRGNSPVFFKCMSAYTAFRLGYGMNLNPLLNLFEGLCLETELGLNLTPSVFAGFSYNYHKYFVNGVDHKLAGHTLSFRLGFNFGKTQEAKKREVDYKQTSISVQQRNYQSDLEREFYQIGTNDKAMLNFFKRNNFTESYTKFASACDMRKDGIGLLSAGVGTMGLGIILLGSGLGTDNANCSTTGFVFIGIGGTFTIASIPVLAVAGGRKRAIKNDFARQYFSNSTYQPTLNFNCTGNGLGIALKL